MKFYITSCFLMLTIFNTKADDLTFNVKNTVKGGSTGAIDLTISGGTSPYSISWTGPNGFTAKTEDIDNLAIGTYTITVNDNYCGTATATVVVKDFTVGIEETSANQVTVFPNPSTTELTVILHQQIKNYQFRLMNILGEISMVRENVSESSLTISVEELVSGIYFIEITEGNKIYRRKILKY